MKVAVSIPDDIFAETETLAHRLKASRSEVYARALAEFVGRHAPEQLTAHMDHAIERIGAEQPDHFQAEAVRRVFKHTDW